MTSKLFIFFRTHSTKQWQISRSGHYLPAGPILKEDQLLLSITAPLAKDDLMPENTIKRPEGQQQRLLSVFTVPEVKPSWDTTMIKEGTNVETVETFYFV